jgi:hypothetical protein
MGALLSAPVQVAELNPPPMGHVKGITLTADGLTLIREMMILSSSYVPIQTDLSVFRRASRTQPFGLVDTTILPYTGTDQSMEDFVPSEALVLTHGTATAYRYQGLLSEGLVTPAGQAQLTYCDAMAPGLQALGALSLGTTPGIAIGSRTIPLNYDSLLIQSVGGVPGATSPLSGQLSAEGLLSSTIGPVPPVFVGAQFYSGFVTLDPSAPFGIGTISNAVALTVFP